MYGNLSACSHHTLESAKKDALVSLPVAQSLCYCGSREATDQPKNTTDSTVKSKENQEVCQLLVPKFRCQEGCEGNQE